MTTTPGIENAYALAREQYAAWGVDTEQAIATLLATPISLHCWQGDDVGGFESAGATLDGGGLAVTGNHPGKARTIAELRADLEMVYTLIPGKHRLNLHAIYGEFGDKTVDRIDHAPEHFSGWVEWAKTHDLGIDFNPTCFSHPNAESGFTLSHQDESIRAYWIEHCRASRRIGEYIGKELGSPCITNIWIPDGYKDMPVDRHAPRARLQQSLDEIFTEKLNRAYLLDAVESKLFGIGSESYVTGSHEFYLGYALKNDTLLCLDAGHFHPTEGIADKLSAVLLFLDEVLLHVSRGVRWDSDHVVLLTDEVLAIAQEIVRGGFLNCVHIGLDFFDASINRIAAWVIGTRAMQKALLSALLEPSQKLRAAEAEGDFTARLAILEECKNLPTGIVWDYLCHKNNIPTGMAWLGAVQQYERETLAQR